MALLEERERVSPECNLRGGCVRKVGLGSKMDVGVGAPSHPQAVIKDTLISFVSCIALKSKVSVVRRTWIDLAKID